VKSNARLLQKKSTYTVDYPWAIEMAETQGDVFWTATEIELEKDLHDLKTNLTESELHGVITVLRLFTEYELAVGTDYWAGRVMRVFQRPDIQRMANCFAFIELNVHAPFYAKINEVLGIATDEFFNSYKENPKLKQRIDWIHEVVSTPTKTEYDILLSLGAFSMIEGAILYSNFAFLKHFQAEGKNKLTNLTAGINFSVRDENLHSLAGARLFTELLSESSLTSKERTRLKRDLERVARKTYEHEEEIVHMIFEKGTIKGITDFQINQFVQHRINLCLEQLGYEGIYEPHNTVIKKWFYKNINSSQLHDFFSKQGNGYNRDWKETAFTWNTLEELT
jgi:ribonucleotide reductase beta subunit family protein with ferritin-like domain